MQHTIALDGTVHTVDAIEPAPGLRVYKHPHLDYGIGTYPVVLGHHSGRSIAHMECTADAIDAGRDLGEMTDWTRPADEINADEALAERVHAYLEPRNAVDTALRYTSAA
ncbi:hypothetical protein [Streptomyces sp. WMMC897]|uniref:hypothetical protein n=1 Tax=Streptomyces sp. WMMC897 TaxID=3014782 RepID=UPI0022B65DA0|nr:hypothetical protein [Streptomyces sp. WMMC897]MCZ7413109.1 hypothetical protein [Streptomyces sp. WMMC897]MCZ7415507.1 hypothetical protein [Streptomyces sp. WMMC897]